MSRRRLWSPNVAALFVLACALSAGPVGAQDTSSSLILRFGMCSWTAETRDVVFATELGTAISSYDCDAGGWSGDEVTFTLDGEFPDSSNGATSTWTNLSDGPHSLDTVPTAPIQLHDDVTVDGDSELWATLYFPQTDDRPEIAPTVVATTTANPDGDTIPRADVSIAIMECQIGGSNAITVEPDAAAGFSGCTAGDINSKEWGIRIDGTLPDSSYANVAVWSNLADGTHTAITGRGASVEFTVTDGAASLVAWYGPGSTTESTSGQAVTALPATGSGREDSLGTFVLAAAAVAGIVLLAMSSLAVRRRR